MKLKELLPQLKLGENDSVLIKIKVSYGWTFRGRQKEDLEREVIEYHSNDTKWFDPFSTREGICKQYVVTLKK